MNTSPVNSPIHEYNMVHLVQETFSIQEDNMVHFSAGRFPIHKYNMYRLEEEDFQHLL